MTIDKTTHKEHTPAKYRYLSGSNAARRHDTRLKSNKPKVTLCTVDKMKFDDENEPSNKRK